MTSSITEPTILLSIAAAFGLVLAAYTWQQRKAPGGVYFSLLMLAATIFAGSNAIELNVTGIPAKILWSKLSYPGVVSLTPLWVLFALSYSQGKTRMNPWRIAALWAIPAITLALVATNEWHHLIWSAISPLSPGPDAQLIFVHGPAFWVYAAYAYLLLIAGTGLLIRRAICSPGPSRKQAYLLAGFALISMLGNILYLAGLNPWPGADLTPVAFLVSGLGMAWTISHYQIFDIVPSSHQAMFENLGDGVVVLDLNQRILDLNPIARRWMGIGDESIGRNIYEVAGVRPSDLQYRNPSQAQLVIEQNKKRRVYDLTISPLKDNHGIPQANLVLLHDISVERNQNVQLESLQRVSQAIASSLEIDQICQTVVQTLHESFAYDYVSIYTLKGDALALGAQVGYPEELIIPVINTDRGILGRTVRTRQVQFVPDVSADPDFLCASYEVGSEICIPLLKDQQVFGTLNVESGHQRVLDEADLGLLTTFANHVVIAMVNASLFQAEREQRELTEALREVSLSLSESLDLESLFDRMLAEIRRVIPHDSACIMQVDENYRQARVARLSGYERYGDGIAQARKELILDVATTPNLRQMAETGKPVVITNTAEDPGWVSSPGSAHIASWVGAPIFVSGKMVAFFALEKTEPGFFQPEHGLRLSTFVGQAAVAIENARLHEAEIRKSKRLEALYSATSVLISTLDLDSLLRQILHAAVGAIPASGKGSLLLVDPVAHQLRINNQVGYSDENVKGTAFDLHGSGFAVRSVREMRPMLVEDVAQEVSNTYQGDTPEIAQIRSAVVAPLILKNQVLGAISIDSTQPGTFSEEDLQLLVGLASIATTALQNARLHREVQQLSVTDPLTACFNRRGLFDLAQREVSRARRMHSPLSMLMIDLDEFKQINDRFGHVAGDRVLEEVAAEIGRGRRSTDILGRYGGDEFALVLPDSGLAEACTVAERLRIQIGSYDFNNGICLTVSIGIGAMDERCADFEALVERADRALLRSKLNGRNQVSTDPQ